MTYTLHRLAPSRYDLVLSGRIVGSDVSEITAGAPVRYAELLDDPFQQDECF
jgi:hypothetical protein